MTCQCTYDYDYRDNCVDEWDLDKYYSCHESPTPIWDCELLHVGDSIEFNVEKERMWGTITEICQDCSLCCDIVVEVTSDLLLDHPFSKGDLLLLEMHCIYNHVVAEENKPTPSDSPCKSPYSLPEY